MDMYKINSPYKFLNNEFIYTKKISDWKWTKNSDINQNLIQLFRLEF